MTKNVRDNRWTILFSLFCVIMFQAMLPVGQHFYQVFSSVVAMEGRIVAQTPVYVDIHITGEKLRTCAYIRMFSMTLGTNGLSEARLESVDKPNRGTTKPVGKLDLGVWRVSPVTGSTKASIYVQHDCDSTVVISKIAEVDLTNAAK